MPKNVNSISMSIALEGIDKIKTEKKNDDKTVWAIFLSPKLWENVNKHCNGFSIMIGCLHRTIIWFSLFIGLFYPQPNHFSRKKKELQCPTKW